MMGAAYAHPREVGPAEAVRQWRKLRGLVWSRYERRWFAVHCIRRQGFF